MPLQPRIKITNVSWSIREGCYNLCDPTQVTTEITFSIKVEDEEKSRRISVSLDEGYSIDYKNMFADDPIEAIRDAVEEERKRLMYSTGWKETKEMMKFIEQYEDEILEMCFHIKIAQIREKIDRFNKEIEIAEKGLAYHIDGIIDKGRYGNAT